MELDQERLQQIADTLQQLFHAGDFAINRQSMERLAQLDASPIALRMHPEILKSILSSSDFPAAQFVSDVLKGFRTNYLRGLAALKERPPFNSPAYAQYNEVCIELGSLVYAVIEFGYLAEDEVSKYLDSDDAWLNRFGAEFLEKFPVQGTDHVEQILATMERTGVDCQPFYLGLSLAARLEQTNALYPYVCKRFDSGNINLKAGLLQTFYDVGHPLPLQVQDLILQTALASDFSTDNEIADLVVIALGRCNLQKPAAVDFLTQCLSSKYWNIRGNATESLAMLGIDDPQLINQIGGMIFDREGYDWSVSSASLDALILLGGKAKCTVPRLLKLAESSLKEEDFNGYPCTNALLAQAFGAIGDSSPNVIESLRKIVEKQGYISAYPATCSLGKLGAAAAPALDTISEYLFGDEMPADSAESALELIGVLRAIAGHEHPLVAKFIEHLSRSPYDEVCTIAESYKAKHHPDSL